MNATELLEVQYQDAGSEGSKLVTHDAIERESLYAPPHQPAFARAGCGWVVANRRGSRRTGWTYLLNAAIHPSNLLMLIGLMVLSVSQWSGPAMLVGLGMEAVFLGVAPRCAFFRRSVDEALDEADRAAAWKVREGLVLEMGEVHRQELRKIEALLDKTFANAQRRRGAVLLAGGDPLSMARLTMSYIHLAISHRACVESLAMTNRDTLQATIRSLEAAETAQPEHARPLLRRWLAIVYRRAECWSRTRDRLETTGHQLATITELVYLMHQESLAPSSSAGSISAEVDRVLADFEAGEGAQRELASLGIDDTDTFAVPEIAAGAAPTPRRPRALTQLAT
jgi:hypothetical protein